MGGSNSEIPAVVAELLCRDLVHNWQGRAQADAGRTIALPGITVALSMPDKETQLCHLNAIDSQAAAKAIELGLDLELMRAAAREILDQELSPDTESYFAKLITQFQATGDADRGAQIIAAIDSALGGGDETAPNCLSTVLNTRLEGRAAKLATAVCDWVFDLVDAAGGVTGAKHAAEWFQHHLRHLQTTISATTGRLREDALARQHAVLRAHSDERRSTMRIWGRKSPAHDINADLREYARVQIEQAITCSVTRWLRLVEAQVNAEVHRLQEFWKDLSTLAGQFHVSQTLEDSFECCGGSDAVPDHWRELFDDLVKGRSDLVAALDREIEKKVAVGPKKLRWFLTEARPIDTQLATPLRAAARQLILAAMHDLNASRLSGNSDGSVESPDYRGCVDAAKPLVGDLAAGTRLLLIVPQDTDTATVRQSLPAERNQEATIVYSSDGDFIAFQEAELLEVRRVAARLIDNRLDYVEIAQRLHTRVDVNWDDMPVISSREPLKTACANGGSSASPANGVGK